MTKYEVAQLILPLVVGYFSVSGERLGDLKVFCFWTALFVLCASHIHNIYLLCMNAELEPWIRYVALNLSAIGFCILVAGAVLLKPHIRDHFMPKNRQA